MQKTGALLSVGRTLTRLGKHKLSFLTVTMVISGITSAFINNTPVVAVMLPLMMGIAAKHEVPPSRWLILIFWILAVIFIPRYWPLKGR